MAKRLSAKKPRKMARKQRSYALWIVLFLLLAGGLAAHFWRPRHRVYVPQVVGEIPQWKAGPEDFDAFADTMAARAKQALIGLGVPREVIKMARVHKSENSRLRWEIRAEVPDVLPLSVCNLSLTRLAHRLGGTVLEGSEDRQGNVLSLRVGLNGRDTDLITLARGAELERRAGRIAIVIDDFGYQDQNLILSFCALSQPITFSIFPNEKHTVWIAQQAIEKNHGVMVHLQMEPIGYPARDPGPNAIFSDDAPERIAELTQNALAAVPHAQGMNNHMGSRVTQNPDAMKVVLQVVKQRGFFFIDSVTSPQSVAYAIAREMGIPSGRNALFLDTIADEDEVIERLYALAARARRESTAIGIGHAKPQTLWALQRVLPELEDQGFTFVLAQEAVR